MSKKLVYGVGINNADYQVQINRELPKVGGERRREVVWNCPFYLKWKGMIARCYSCKFHEGNPTYKDCSVCEEWLLFSNFRKWMVTQDWEGKHLDKDILFGSNKVYSPETCIFIVGKVNTFIGDCGGSRGDYLIGSMLPKNTSRFVSRCSNPFKDEGDLRKYHIGLFDTEIEAHLAWKKQKHGYAVELANSDHVTDERVRQALLHKYKNYSIVEDHIK